MEQDDFWTFDFVGFFDSFISSVVVLRKEASVRGNIKTGDSCSIQFYFEKISRSIGVFQLEL